MLVTRLKGRIRFRYLIFPVLFLLVLFSDQVNASDADFDEIVIEATVFPVAMKAGEPANVTLCLQNQNRWTGRSQALLPEDHWTFVLSEECGFFSALTPSDIMADFAIFSSQLQPGDFSCEVTPYVVSITYVGQPKPLSQPAPPPLLEEKHPRQRREKQQAKKIIEETPHPGRHLPSGFSEGAADLRCP